MPGNPGIPHYYCGFGEELQKSFEAEGLDSPTILGLSLKSLKILIKSDQYLTVSYRSQITNHRS